MGQAKAGWRFQFNLKLHMPPAAITTSTNPLLPRLRHKAFPEGEGVKVLISTRVKQPLLQEGNGRGHGGGQSQNHIHSAETVRVQNSNIPQVKDSKILRLRKAHTSKDSVFLRFYHPSNSMLLILETLKSHCSLLVPKSEGSGSDKVQREKKNEREKEMVRAKAKNTNDSSIL